jgi:replicative DNA helicase
MLSRMMNDQKKETLFIDNSGPASLAQIMEELDQEFTKGDATRFRPIPTGFTPLDDVLNGGLHPGELMIVGGPFGVGKTIFGLQIARNVVANDETTGALYICFEHDQAHLLLRLLCLESAEQNFGQEALTLKRLTDIANIEADNMGVIGRLHHIPQYTPLIDSISHYSNRLILVKASSDTSSLEKIRQWISEYVASGIQHLVVVVDYLQKIPVNSHLNDNEADLTTYIAQGLKEMALSMGIRIIAIAASDRPGLKAKRMRLADMRGSSALQYEADIGVIMNNKHEILSREHMLFNLNQAETMRNWIILSVEKNRSGRSAIDMEFQIKPAHFQIVTTGNLVRERLVDDKIIKE